MANTPLSNVSVKVAEYNDGSGQVKGRWKTIGRLYARPDGSQFIMLDSTVLNMSVNYLVNKERQDRVPCSLFPIEQRQQSGGGGKQQPPAQQQPQNQAAQPPAGDPEFDDDIPF